MSEIQKCQVDGIGLLKTLFEEISRASDYQTPHKPCALDWIMSMSGHLISSTSAAKQSGVNCTEISAQHEDGPNGISMDIGFLPDTLRQIMVNTLLLPD